MSSAMLAFLRTLAIEVKNEELFLTAFTHASYVHENPDQSDYERLEFIGDSILDFVIAYFIYRAHPTLDQGKMTKLRSNLVCGASLASKAEKLGFGSFMRLGHGEIRSGGRKSPKILEDIFEAFIGALYLDQGIAVVMEFLQKQFEKEILDYSLDELTDYKSRLQEAIQADRPGPILYRVLKEEGSSQQKCFTVEVLYDKIVLGTGQGKNKKKAEQAAAKDALSKKVT